MAPTKKAPAKAEVKPSEPLIRVAISGTDMARLVEYIEEWDDPLAYRLRMRYAQHRRKFPS